MLTSVKAAGPRSPGGFMVAGSGKSTEEDLLTIGRFRTRPAGQHAQLRCRTELSYATPPNSAVRPPTAGMAVRGAESIARSGERDPRRPKGQSDCLADTTRRWDRNQDPLPSPGTGG